MQYHPENDPQHIGLSVNEGVSDVPIVNPYARPRRIRQHFSVDDYTNAILKGDMTMLSRAVTLVESSLPSDQATAQAVIEKCLPYAGKSIRLGITGVPGAGKSTFIKLLLREETPTKGIVKVNGYNLNKIKKRQIPPNIPLNQSNLVRRISWAKTSPLFIFFNIRLVKERIIQIWQRNLALCTSFIKTWPSLICPFTKSEM